MSAPTPATQHVSLVRVDSTWHVFSDTRAADAFYRHWAEYRDAELLAELHVDPSAPADVRELWAIA